MSAGGEDTEQGTSVAVDTDAKGGCDAGTSWTGKARLQLGDASEAAAGDTNEEGGARAGVSGVGLKVGAGTVVKTPAAPVLSRRGPGRSHEVAVDASCSCGSGRVACWRGMSGTTGAGAGG